MLIKDMFVKPIDRDIKGVVKVGQDDKKVIQQELEEYVVTKELVNHFRDFFTAYKKGIHHRTDKIGVWISGYFGSGKSHFLKILSYILSNTQVEGKKAIDYFKDNEKIKSAMIFEDMKLAASFPTDVILFNIDAKSETSGKKDKETILNVFLKVFNENLGYSTNPYVADLERQLAEDNRYQDFQERYMEITGEEWLGSRHKFNFFKDRVVKTVVAMDYMALETANDWVRSTINPYEISIEEFAQLVRKHINSQARDHRLIFLVDEIGQYIGSNSDLMLNLQTITEELGRLCEGKAWIAVTSQQDIDSVIKVMAKDFSKIQGRFDTRLSLTSANVDEVIKLRILEKEQPAQETLSIIYDNKETIIKNLIIFNDSVEKKLYKDKKDFCQVYPFIPYQFNVLASVLTSVRRHSSTGKHLSEGERSMLALFKESAEAIMYEDDGALVPFNIFYNALKKFLDHSHSVVISRALGNNYINPNNEEDNFNVNVLKTLFMIKYINEVEANLENITTLMVSHIDQDRRLLKERVENALDILMNQMLVQKDGDIYIFLTDEEQEINRDIENQDIESQDLTRKVSEIIFADIFFEDKIKAPGYQNKNPLGFNRGVDELPYKANQSFDFGVKVITPMSGLNGQGRDLRMLSSAAQDVYVDLPNDGDFLQELRTAMKIEKFLNSPSAYKLPKLKNIKNIKRDEMKKHNDRAKLFLQESLKAAKFYVNGDLLDLATKDFKYNITESLERLVSIVYSKINYITHPMDESDIYNIFTKKTSQIKLDDGKIPNEIAISEVLNYIRQQTKNHTKISLREIENRFIKAPYGFLDLDVKWIIAKSFKEGLISFTINGNNISLLREIPEKIADYILKKAYLEKLLIEEKEIIPDHLKKILKTVSKEVFNATIFNEDTDAMVVEFNKSAKLLIEDLKSTLRDYQDKNYPGKDTISKGISLIQMTIAMDKSIDVFNYVKKQEDNYLDFGDDYGPIYAFFGGDQREIWDKCQYHLDIFEDSRSFIFNEDIEKITNRMKAILAMANPYDNIKELPGLIDDFITIYNNILDKELEPVLVAINDADQRVIELLEKSGLEEKFFDTYKQTFIDLKKKARDCNNVARVNNYRLEADKIKIRFIDEITRELEKRKDIEKVNPGYKPQIIIKRQRNISIKDINHSNSWQIETKEDIEKYLQDLRKRLEKEIEENTILNIEF